MYDWIIIGGGIHGVTVATFLLSLTDVSRDKLRIIDPNDNLLSFWQQRTAAVGMKSLRSTSVHHLDIEPFSLERFANSREGRVHGKLRGKYEHPDLALFNAHCEKVIEKNSLESLHIKDSVLSVEATDFLADKKLSLSNKTLLSRNVVLALGSPKPFYPNWVEGLSRDGKLIFHVFELREEFTALRSKNIAVIGGGLSSAQIALKLREVCSPKRVKMFSRHELRQSQFDSDPGWIGPKYRTGFEKTSCPQRKRNKIKEARKRGSITPEVYSALKRSIRSEEIEFEIIKSDLEEGILEDSLKDFDAIVLATGFEGAIPGQSIVSDISRNFNLALSPCGFPLLKESVHWGKGFYCSGALAEMRIGPVARNIPGARSAAEEIVQEALCENKNSWSAQSTPLLDKPQALSSQL